MVRQVGGWLSFLLAWLFWQPSQAQHLAPITHWEDSLVKLGYTLYQNPSEPERLKANFDFVQTLVQALKTPNSFYYSFETLNMISNLVAPDSSFRLFSWHVPLNDGSFLYYGAIQKNTKDGKLILFPLLDQTFEIHSPSSTITSNKQWYGSQYYEIIPFNKSYLLLGWKGHSSEITQKIIEVLAFEPVSGEPIFGKKIFKEENSFLNVYLLDLVLVLQFLFCFLTVQIAYYFIR